MKPRDVPTAEFPSYLERLIDEVRGMNTLDYSVMVKDWSVTDFRMVLSAFGVECKEYEGRTILLARLHKVLKSFERRDYPESKSLNVTNKRLTREEYNQIEGCVTPSNSRQQEEPKSFEEELGLAIYQGHPCSKGACKGEYKRGSLNSFGSSLVECNFVCNHCGDVMRVEVGW